MSDQVSGLFIMSIMLGFTLGLMLICREDGKPFGFYRRMRCKSGKHRHKVRIGAYRRSLYHCADCKKPRKHPVLQVVQGGKVELNSFKF